MAKRRYIGFKGQCQITKVTQTGQKAKFYMKCPGNKKIIKKTLSAQEILESA